MHVWLVRPTDRECSPDVGNAVRVGGQRLPRIEPAYILTYILTLLCAEAEGEENMDVWLFTTSATTVFSEMVSSYHFIFAFLPRPSSGVKADDFPNKLLKH